MQTRNVTVGREGLALDGRPFFLLAGQVHYFRWPRAEWRGLLLKARAGGLNTIDTVIPWNLHEPEEGRFDFDEEADLSGYLDLCAELGLYAIVRPGPYICAEWENGGFPAWLTARPGVELRVDDPVYLERTARWFDALFPILAERQVTRGGPIILCQIENEHWASGRYGHDDHQRTLARMAIERGMDVPQYTCMGAMDDWPEFRNGWSGIAEKLQQTRALWADNPMIVSELWSGWFDNWGDSRHNHRSAARLDQILHQLAAVGASGVSHWMWAGGTNFAFWGGRTVGGDTIHNTASYDYDAPVSEYGGLTDKFFVARRHHLLWSTLGIPLASTLADARPGGPPVIAPAAVAGRGEAGSLPYRNVSAGPGAPVGWERFTATFLQNHLLEGQTYQLYLQDPAAHLAVEVEGGTIKPIFTNLPLAPTTHDRAGARSSVVLQYHTSRILGFWERPDADWLVLYGREGERGELQLGLEDGKLYVEGDVPANLSLGTRHSSLHVRYWITDRPTVVTALAGGRALRVVLLTQARAERWWPAGDGFVCGPHLVVEESGDGEPAASGQAPGVAMDFRVHQEVLVDRRGVEPFYEIGDDGQVRMLELPQDGPIQTATVVWHSTAASSPSPDSSPSPGLVWEGLPVAEASAADGWAPLDRPVAMEELGCLLGYGWYRAELELDGERRMSLAAPWLSDRARALLDGADVGSLGVGPAGPRLTLDLTLPPGRHELRLLLDNLGRFNYGSNTGERKGLLDTLYLDGRQDDITGGWTALWQEATFAGEALAAARPAYVRADARDVSLASFAFQGPSVWLLRDVEAVAGRSYLLYITGDRNPGSLFVNGVSLTRFSRHYGGGFIKADVTSLLRPGANTLALNITGYGGIAWRATLLSYDASQPLPARWSFRAGVTPTIDHGPPASEGDAGSSAVAPCFWRGSFAYDPALHGTGPFRLAPLGLRKGQIWLNGRNVGRYWQAAGPQEHYKLPASWLRALNELLIFEEEGGWPDGAWIGGLSIERWTAGRAGGA